MTGTRQIAMWLALAWLGAGCAEWTVPQPVLDQVCQSADSTECLPFALAGTPTELVLLGEHFHPGYTVDLSSDSSPELGRFRARVGEASLTQLVLVPDPESGQEVLAGLLPATLDLGIYDVEIETPGGQQARLLDGFRITSPLQVGATTETARAPVGTSIVLRVGLENRGAAPLRGVGIELSQGGSGSVLLPAAPQSFDIEAGGARTVDLAMQASLAGPVSVDLEVQATVGDHIPVGSGQTLQVDLTVLREASLSASGSVSPAIAKVGDEFELRVEVRCQGETPALEVGLTGVQLEGSGAVELAPLPSQQFDIPADSSRIFLWGGTASTPGTVEITLEVQGQEAVSGRPLGPEMAGPILLQIQSP